jgi:hypothetical protein
MRVVLRICPHYSFSHEKQLTQSPKYYYEASDLQHFTVYESARRDNGKTYLIDTIYDQNTSQLDIYEKEVLNFTKDTLLVSL